MKSTFGCVKEVYIDGFEKEICLYIDYFEKVTLRPRAPDIFCPALLARSKAISRYYDK